MSDLLDQRVQLVVSSSHIKKVDDWRRVQSDLPSRSEAIRRLIELGLEAAKKPEPAVDPKSRVD